MARRKLVDKIHKWAVPWDRKIDRYYDIAGATFDTGVLTNYAMYRRRMVSMNSNAMVQWAIDYVTNPPRVPAVYGPPNIK